MAKTAQHEKRPSSVKSMINAAKPDRQKQRDFANAEEMYDYYINSLLRPFLKGDMEASKYEDECRQIFGIASYVLFTIDKLLSTLVKQVTSLTEFIR
jgi:paired amphipathic helix protein Sin3a